MATPLTDQLFYVSAATRPYDDAVVRSILSTARRNNPRRDVTGCLLYSGLYFGQVLEGRPEVISDMLAQLGRDGRHTDVRSLSRTTAATRVYGNWSMGYMHSLDLQDRLALLLAQTRPDPSLVAAVREAIRPDPVTGFL